jgi:hypothetical protein
MRFYAYLKRGDIGATCFIVIGLFFSEDSFDSELRKLRNIARRDPRARVKVVFPDGTDMFIEAGRIETDDRDALLELNRRKTKNIP